MNKRLKLFVSAGVMAFLLCIPGSIVSAQEENGLQDETTAVMNDEELEFGKFKYKLTEYKGITYAELTECKIEGAEVIIPGHIDKYPTGITEDLALWMPFDERYKTIRVESGCKIISENAEFLFSSLDNLEVLDLSGLDTSDVTDMSDMFYLCKSLKSLKLSSFDTSDVTDMSDMFFGCQELENLDLSKFNTENVTNMQSMFQACFKLKSLDLRSFNTEKVEYMDGMFRLCKSLESLDLSSFNTEKVEYMEMMFKGCSSLESLDVSSFNTENVTRIYGMFGECSSLKSLDLSNFNTMNVDSLTIMFDQCSSLKSLDLSNFNTENVEGMEGMFRGCSSLESLDLSSFNTEKVEYMEMMFMGCSSLESLDLSSFNTEKVEKVEYMEKMFYVDSQTPLLVVTDDSNLLNYNYTEDNRHSPYTFVLDANEGKYSDDTLSKDYFEQKVPVTAEKARVEAVKQYMKDNVPAKEGFAFDGWEFVSGKNIDTVDSFLDLLGNTTYRAKWVKEYAVSYKFKSGTDGKELPAEVNKICPSDSRKYKEGETISAIPVTSTEVEVSDGVWTFAGYDAYSKIAAQENLNPDGNVCFTGTWTFALDASELNAVSVISAEDKTLTVGETFDPKKDVTASDTEDGDLTDKIEIVHNDVDTSKAGTYTVTYKVTDSEGASVTKTITVTVKAKEPEGGTDTPDKPTKPEGSTDTPDKPEKPDTGANKNNSNNGSSNQAGNQAVKTGDSSNVMLWGAFTIISAMALLTAAVKKKRK